MKITVAQINSKVGDIEGNLSKVLDAYKNATGELVVFPELALMGYPPEDLLISYDFIKREQMALQKLCKQVGKIPLIIGATHLQSENLYNAAYLIQNGKIEVACQKTALPNYGVFDEKRYFTPSYLSCPVMVGDVKVGVLICEDMWTSEKAATYAANKVDMLVAINASPYEAGKLQQRHEVARARVSETKLPLVYVNAVGGQDELVFDGGSFLMDEDGEIISSLPEFEEVVTVPKKPVKNMGINESRYNAMCLGLKDYLHKNGFKKIVLGLSGGVDSALVAVIAADALGKENVRLVMLPSKFTSKESLDDAAKLAKNLGIELENISIEPAMAAFEQSLKPSFKARKKDLTEENIQSRIRGVMLMALSNKFNELLLTTGNKSEIATGYSTLYGDSCGAFNPIKDLYKTEVYEVARWRNSDKVIPKRILTKAPSAELRENQKDQDSLPQYDLLDAVLKQLIEGRKTAKEVIAEGFKEEVVEKVARLLNLSEYKRRQAAPGVKLTSTSFGRDWRYPITKKI
jgi:NAD+ synthase